MTEKKDIRLSKAARELNVGTATIVEFLASKNIEVAENPNSKITPEQYKMLRNAFQDSIIEKEEAAEVTIGTVPANNTVVSSPKKHRGAEENAADTSDQTHTPAVEEEEEELVIKTAPVVARQQPAEKQEPVQPEKTPEPVPEKKEPIAEAKKEDPELVKAKLPGLNIVGKIDLPTKETKETKDRGRTSSSNTSNKKDKRPPKRDEKPTKNKVSTPAVPKTPPAVVEKEKEKKEVQLPPSIAKESEPVDTSKPVVASTPPPEAAEDTQKTPAAADSTETKDTLIEAKADRLQGLKVLGKIELPSQKAKRGAKDAKTTDADAKNTDADAKKRRRRRRRRRRDGDGTPTATTPAGTTAADVPKKATPPTATTPGTDNKTDKAKDRKRTTTTGKRGRRNEPSEEEVQSNLKATLAQISGSKNTRQSQRRTARKERRAAHARAHQRQMEQEAEEAKILRVTEFVAANDLASMMDVSVNELISACFSMGMIVTINHRLDADTIALVADEFGYEVEFVGTDEEIDVQEEEDNEEDMIDRPPIVTIMGHVDHGKTTLLDYIRSAKVAAGEAGGITQHIGAYQVKTESGRRVTFLDTPGHEAFTAMRARGTRLTDVAIIVVAADDGIMPQTREAINHALSGSVPIVIAINKMDKPAANPTRVKKELADMNVLIEEYGGEVLCQEISAKTGQGIDDLLESVLLAAEILELKANPDKRGVGSVIEASLDKGRGYVSTVLVQAGTIHVGDVILAGSHYGKIRAMTDYRGKKLKKAGPSFPVQILGLDGAPQAGDQFNVMETEREAREIAAKRKQIMREQTIRATRRLTLSDIGRRQELGNFQQLNIVLKGDVDGSVEAISDALLKLSNAEVEVNIIHKGVGMVSESDILLASTAEAIVIAFQVRPSRQSKALADQENIEVRTYSIIYKIIEDVKLAIEGMLSPEIQEEIVGNVEVREVFKISKVGSVAGCYVTNGYIKRNSKVRLIREGVVMYTGKVGTLKRYKDDAAEVKYGFECGLMLEGFNDVVMGDEIEVFEEREIKRRLDQVEKA